MMRVLRVYLFGAVVVGALGALAGCGGHYLFVEREPWRHEAELQCMNSGVIKEGSGKVRISPIDGPGMCGADFPLKVSSLGDGMPLSYGDELRPPAAIPGAAARHVVGQFRTSGKERGLVDVVDAREIVGMQRESAQRFHSRWLVASVPLASAR